jgi:hypothetical protein
MHSKRTVLVALALLLLLVPFGTSIAAADSGNSNQAHTQTVSLSLMGGVTNAGFQKYVLRGGQLAFGSVDNHMINPKTATIYYSMDSYVNGLNVWGYSNLELNAKTMGGKSVSIRAWTAINNAIPAVELPLGCKTNCTSEIPAFFAGGSFVKITIAGHTETHELGFVIESAYLNPFGGPIVLSFVDSKYNPVITLAATYTTGRITWTGVQMGGFANSSKDIGTFAMNVNSRENLVTGIEYDNGTIALFGVGPKGHNLGGTFQGTSWVPTLGASDCSAAFGLPPGTCTMTGLNSTGTMNLFGGHYQVVGHYHTIWGLPAIGFRSTVTGFAYPIHHHDGQYSQMESTTGN